jgi:hypothetical protein
MHLSSAPRRLARLRYIEELDPGEDYEEIHRIISGYEFPWDYWQSLSLAFFRTFAVPRISGLLDQTGELVAHTQKRADDTMLIMYEIARLGMESSEGRAYIRRMNRMHQRYEISNEDSAYIISLLITVPIKWINQFGWRRLTENEEQALTNYSRRLAELMGVKDTPSTFADFQLLARSYERGHFAVTDANRRLAEATMSITADMLPGPLRRPLQPVMRRFSLAILDEELLEALGLPVPPSRDRRAAALLLRWRGRLLRVLPPRSDGRRYRLNLTSYKNGYRLGDVGPDWIREENAAATKAGGVQS